LLPRRGKGSSGDPSFALILRSDLGIGLVVQIFPQIVVENPLIVGLSVTLLVIGSAAQSVSYHVLLARSVHQDDIILSQGVQPIALPHI
jgi:hypothetical protein